jgi:long-chain acyl-CoA synthetase
MLYRDRVAFRELDAGKHILEYTFAQLGNDVDALGTALLSMGMGDWHVSVLGENSYGWVVAYLAVANGLGVVVPMDKELPSADIAKLLNKSDSDAIICSETYVPVLESILSECPGIKACVVMNATKGHADFHDIQELIRQGEALLNAGDRSYLERPIDPQALCEIIFTSGTTGANKGVMLSHKNIVSVIYGIMHHIVTPPVSFSVLPVSHSFECTCHVLGGIHSGTTLCFNDSLKHLMENMRLFRPGMCVMVPLFLETMYKSIWKEAEKSGLAGHLRWGIALSNALRKIGIDLRKLYFKPVIEKFGGNLRLIVCGGAPLRNEVIRGLDEIGITVVNGYGITECAPVISSNSSEWQRAGSVGRVLPVCHARIDEPDACGNGEVLVKGDIVMLGYYKDPASTQASFTPDGYFRTGDLGRLDRKNFLYLSGRKKNLIILSNGKNVCPEEVEEEVLTQIPYVKEVVVYSRLSDCLQECIHADVVLDEEYARSAPMEALREKLDQDIRRLNARLPIFKRIQSVGICDQEFEKTTTKKIKRQVLLEGGPGLA